MASQEDDTGCVVWLLVTVVAVGFGYNALTEYSARPAKPIEPVPIIEAEAVPAPKKTVPPYSRVKPEPYYTAAEYGVYHYVAEVSEDARKAGASTGDVVSFRYLGKNDKGQHVLQQIGRDGAPVSFTSACANPCKIIRHSDGGLTAYSNKSIIGGAFRDAFMGFLKVSKRPASNPTSTRIPIASPSIPGPDDSETLPVMDDHTEKD